MSTKRPQQNTDGQSKQASANPDGKASAAPPGQAPSTAPHSALKSNLAGAAAGAAVNAAPGLGMLQTRVNFRDMAPPMQQQVEQQMGLNPFAGLQMGQQAVDQAMMPQAPGSPVPQQLTGPGIPADAGLENFPHDIAALQSLMTAGYSPGASPLEHAQAQNAHAVARAMDVQAMQQSQSSQAHADANQQIAAILQRLQLMHGENAAMQQAAQPQGPLASSY